jgi:hypothetical protein
MMNVIGFQYWKDDSYWIGYLEELEENLKDLFKDLSTGKIPEARRHAELELV